jgi:hypothetical protein
MSLERSDSQGPGTRHPACGMPGHPGDSPPGGSPGDPGARWSWRVPILLLALSALLALPALPGGGGAAGAQTVEEQLGALVEDNAALYVLPLTEGLGYALNSGLFDAAHAMGAFRFDISARVFGALTPVEVRRFDAILPDSLHFAHPTLGSRSYPDPYRPRGDDPSTPSAAGTGAGVVLEPAGSFRQDLLQAGENPDEYNLRFPEGLDLSVIPYAVVQLVAGVGFGSEVMLRFLPTFELGSDVGNARALGWGVKHEISRWVELPIDLSLQVGHQSVEVGDYLDGSSREMGILAGRTFGPLSVYGTAGTRQSSVEVRYRVANPEGLPTLPEDGTEVAFRSGLDSSLAMGAGFRLQFLLLNLAGQYLAGDYDSFSVKVGLGLP